MKKRILSLILAFAMAATLAPATALVGTSVSKAAADGTLTLEVMDFEGTAGNDGDTNSVGLDFDANGSDFSDGYELDVKRGITKGEFYFELSVASDDGTNDTDSIRTVKVVPVGTQTGNRMNPSSAPTLEAVNGESSGSLANGKATIKMTGVNNTAPGVYNYILEVYRKGEKEVKPGDSAPIKITITKQYKVTYKTGNGALAGQETYMVSPGVYEYWVDEITVAGGGYTLETPERAGYTADGFKKVLNGKTTSVPSSQSVDDVIGDVEYTVNWVSAESNLVLVRNSIATDRQDVISNQYGSTTDMHIYATVGQKLPTNVFKYPGRTFAGWTNVLGGGIVKYQEGATVTEDLLKESAGNLYAIWRLNELTINFNANVPKDFSLSQAGGTMNTIKVPARTEIDEAVNPWAAFQNKYVISGKQFVGWSTDAEGHNLLGTDYDIYDRALLNPDGVSSITLYAQWIDSTKSLIVYNLEAGSAGNTIAGIAYDVANTSGLDGFTGKVGYVLTSATNKWTYADGTVIVAGSNIEYDDKGIASIYPIYEAAPIPVEYKDDGADVEIGTGVTASSNPMKVTGIRRTQVNVSSGTIALPTVSATYETVRGWRVTDLSSVTNLDALALMKADGFNKNAFYTTSFNAGDIITAIAKYVGDGFDGTITMELVTLPNIGGARFEDLNDKSTSTDPKKYNFNTSKGYTFDYGTAQSDIEEALEDEIELVYANAKLAAATKNIYDNKASNIDVVDLNTAAGDFVKWSVTPAYSGFPKNNSGKYLFTGQVYARAGAYGNGGDAAPIGTVYANVEVGLKGTPTDVYVTSITNPATINLSGDATAADIISAIRSIKSLSVKADDGKAYTVQIMDSNNDYVTTNLKGSETDVSYVLLGNYRNDTVPAYVGNSDPEHPFDIALGYGVNTFTYAMDVESVLTPSGVNGVTLKVGDGFEHVAVTINIGAASTDTDKEDKVAAEVEKAKKFLEQGYSIRMYDRNRGEHIYTAGIAEVEMLLKAGWVQETTEKNSFKMSSTKTDLYDTAIYRIYNKNNGGAHMFTKNKAEAQAAVNKGWTWDNKGEPVFYVSNDPTKGTKVYRALNPNKKSGEHAWSVSKAEHDNLIKLGWKDESTDNNVWYSPN